MAKEVEWWGGPFDGSVEILPDEAVKFAVAWDLNRKRVTGIPDLQQFCSNPEWRSQHPKFAQVVHVCVYPVTTVGSRHWLYYRECRD